MSISCVSVKSLNMIHFTKREFNEFGILSRHFGCIYDVIFLVALRHLEQPFYLLESNFFVDLQILRLELSYDETNKKIFQKHCPVVKYSKNSFTKYSQIFLLAE